MSTGIVLTKHPSGRFIEVEPKDFWDVMPMPDPDPNCALCAGTGMMGDDHFCSCLDQPHPEPLSSRNPSLFAAYANAASLAKQAGLSMAEALGRFEFALYAEGVTNEREAAR